jgi:RNA polymerase sigma factor (sigma-70 family)
VARERNGTVLRHLRTLFDVGVAAGLTDGQLLERFATRRGEPAESAFATIVERHGPMVLRTCRGILRDGHDAQDASQATFLILVRSGGTLWVRDSLGPWLHRVACRVAARAKHAADRRRAAERRAAESAACTPGEVDRADIEGPLHEEIDRLPERYRIPIVLCILEGRTYEEAARHLGCPVGTVKSRLARGREQLRGRLSRRGLAPPAGVVGAALLCEAASAALPGTALEPVARVALRIVADRAGGAGAVPEAVLALADGVLRSMLLTKWKWAAAIVMAVAIVCSGAGRVAAWASGALEARAEPIRRLDRNPEAPPARDADPVAMPRSGRTVTEERGVPPFDEIHVACKVRVVVTPGPDYRVTAVGDTDPPWALSTRVEKRSKHDRLLLDVIPLEGKGQDKKAGGGHGGLEVRITTPRLFGVIARGHATVEIRDLRNESLALTVWDSARTTVSGVSNSVTAVLGDSGELDASRLGVEDATVEAAGRSAGIFHARKSLRLMASGDARVEYIGTPARLDTITSGRSRLLQRP